MDTDRPIEEQAIQVRRNRIEVDDMTHTDPGTVAGQYMRRFWHPVLMAEELQPARALPVTIMGEHLTLYRGEAGAVHAVGQRCAHRGAALSVGFVEGENIRCLYHGWKFDPTGQCVEQPAEPDDSLMANARIKSYPVREYLGLVFVYVGDGEVPELPRFPEFEEPGVCDAYFYERECNFFQNLENGVDEAHLPFTHRKTFFDVLNRDVPLIGAKETEYGLIQTGTRRDGTVRMTHALMPNMLTFAHPSSDDLAVTDWALYLSWRVPIDDTRHKSFIVEHFKVMPGDEEAYKTRRREQKLKQKAVGLASITEVGDVILKGKARLSDFADRPDFVNIQDDVAQRAQDVNQDRSAEWLGRSDVAVVMLRRLWARELTAVARGLAPTHWRYPLKLERPKGV